jgi:ligand-binding SRPBCC domain-containing protein
MTELVLERVQTLPRPIDEVFRFFADPSNLEAITPPWLHFRIVGVSSETVGEGTTIDYRLRLRGVPIAWRSVIRSWQPPRTFVDQQLRGPYRLWVHTHRFEACGDETRMTDHVRYAVPGGRLVNRWLVRPDLERIFDYRRDRIAELLGREGAATHTR